MNINELLKFSAGNFENLNVIDVYEPEHRLHFKLPLFMEPIPAGFPSPADDYIENRLDLNEYLIKNPNASFFVRVTGDSMVDVGMYSGDVLLVDRSLTPKDGSIVIAVLNGELTVKRLHHLKNKIFLYPENKNYKPIEITEEMNFEIWGVVTNVIHSLM